jgi:hypothetical protein
MEVVIEDYEKRWVEKLINAHVFPQTELFLYRQLLLDVSNKSMFFVWKLTIHFLRKKALEIQKSVIFDKPLEYFVFQYIEFNSMTEFPAGGNVDKTPLSHLNGGEPVIPVMRRHQFNFSYDLDLEEIGFVSKFATGGLVDLDNRINKRQQEFWKENEPTIGITGADFSERVNEIARVMDWLPSILKKKD